MLKLTIVFLSPSTLSKSIERYVLREKCSKVFVLNTMAAMQPQQMIKTLSDWPREGKENLHHQTNDGTSIVGNLYFPRSSAVCLWDYF